MITRFIRFLVFATLLLSLLPALGQSDPYNGYAVQQYTDEDGLPQNTINGLLVDKRGFLWLAAQVGMIRFNGSSFKLFTTGDKPLLQSNVLVAGKDPSGDIYFKTNEENLYIHSSGSSRPPQLVNSPSLGHPLLLNDQKQLFDFHHFLQDDLPHATHSLRKQIFRSLLERTGNYYVADSAQVYLIWHDTLYYYNNLDLRKLTALSGGNPDCLTLHGKFYVLKGDSVLKAWDRGHLIREATAIGGDMCREPAGGKQAPRYRLFTGDACHLQVNSRLYRLSEGKDGQLDARFLLDLNFLSHITDIEYKQDLDLLFIATATEGFYILRKNGFRSASLPGSLKDQLSQYLFGPMALNRDGEILTNSFLFRPAGEFHMLSAPVPPRQRCLYPDRKGAVWSSVFNLPRKMSSRMEVIRVFPALDGQIIDYTEDTAGHLYCLTEHSLYKLESDSFRLLYSHAQPTLAGDNETFCEATPGKFWIGSVSGLLEYDPAQNKATSIPDLTRSDVRSITRCRDGSILLGTYGQGYFYYRQGHFYRMPLDKNDFLVTAHCFLEDRQGAIWIPCNKGLFKVLKADIDAWCDSGKTQLTYYYYGRQDGLSSNEFNGGFNTSGLITPTGFAALLSMKGIVCFYPDSLKTDFPTGDIDITGISADGKQVMENGSISLPSDYNNLLIEISCPFLGNRNNLSLEYCVKGLSTDWKQVPEDGPISLNRLGPGNYTLVVRKVNGFGPGNYQYRECSIVVIPHFYRTTWFILLTLIVLVLLLILLIQLWIKLVEKRREVRVKAEKLKGTVATLEETVKKLQESRKALLQTSKLKEKLISLVIHDLRSPLRFLTMLAGDLHENQQGFSPGEIRERTYWIKKGTQDLYNFSEDFLLWVTSQKNNFTITRRVFPVRPLLQEIYDFFREQVRQKGNTISYDAPEELEIWSDPHILITIIRNLADNANKYTDRGNIDITAAQEGDQIIIAVSDTGKGMTPKQVEAFLQYDNMVELKTGSQLGHKFVFDLTRRINGTVSIDSVEGRGTTVRLHLPASGQ